MIEIEYTDTDNIRQKKEINPSRKGLNLSRHHIREIDLSFLLGIPNLEVLFLNNNGLKNIDLKPLASCKNMKLVNLSFNLLNHIDLNPLESCRKLKHVDFGGNNLSSIDLTALRGLRNLSKIRVDNNELKEIDLAPLSNIWSLEKLDLSSNILTSIDLEPLLFCVNLEGVFLENNHLKSIDIKPLVMLGRDKKLLKDQSCGIIDTYNLLGGCAYNSQDVQPINTEIWDTIIDIINKYSSLIDEGCYLIGLQHLILKALGLTNLGIFDGPFHIFFEGITKDMKIEGIKNLLEERMIDLQTQQLLLGGCTLFMDVESLKTSKSSKLVPQIIENRKREIENIRINKIGDQYDVSSLWLTGYGNSILNVLGIRKMRVVSTKYKQIIKAIRELGGTIKRSKKTVTYPKISHEMNLYFNGNLHNNFEETQGFSRRSLEITTLTGSMKYSSMIV